MNLTKNIFFNSDKIVENTTIKITYCGDLFQNESEKVFIHFGYGLLWSNVSEAEMTKKENGFEAEIELTGTDSFNCCFKNENNVWDNNEGHNYSFEIEKNELAVAKSVENNLPAKKLSRTYIWGKKLKILFYKVITSIPKLFGSSYKRKDTDNAVPQ